MKQTMTKHDFMEAFRTLRPENFSRAGLEALYDYLIEMEGDTGEEMEFDCIGLCCEFTEYESEQEAREAYGLDDLSDYTTVIQTESGSVILLDF